MLDLNNAMKVGDVVGFRLNTGEEIITKIVSKASGHFVISKPLTLTMDKEGAVAFSPIMYMADANESVNLYKTSIAAEFKPHADFVNSYESAISPIVTPEKNVVI